MYLSVQLDELGRYLGHLCDLNPSHDTEHYHHSRKFFYATSNNITPQNSRGKHCSDYFSLLISFFTCSKISLKIKT